LRADTLQLAVDLRISVGADPGQTALLLEAAHAADASVDRMVEVADLWQLAGDSSASLRAMESAVERAPDDLALLLALAGTLTGVGRDGEALALYEDVLVRDSTHSQALVMVATLRERAGDVAGAETAWQTLVDAWPDVPGGWIRFAAFVERTGDDARAAMLRARAASIAEAR
jgi:Flp pilus assembly protein TadD